MMVTWLNHAIEGGLDYCELYGCQDNNGVAIPCAAHDWPVEFKVACRSGRRFQKSHDFDFRLFRSDQFKYVVTVRDPIPSLVSWWHITDKQDTLDTFMLEMAPYWRTFAQKWLSERRDNVLVTKYEDLTTNVGALREVLAFLDVGISSQEAIDQTFIDASAITHRPIAEQPYFNRDLFAAVERAIGAEIMGLAGYVPRYSTA